jgi:hypothetical protein
MGDGTPSYRITTYEVWSNLVYRRVLKVSKKLPNVVRLTQEDDKNAFRYDTSIET